MFNVSNKGRNVLVLCCSGTDHRLHTDFAFILGNWLHFFTKRIDAELGMDLNNCLMLKFLCKHVGFPKSVEEECDDFLKNHESYYEEGLTKPWI